MTQSMTDTLKRQASLSLILVLGALGALTPLAIDIYLPAMPMIGDALGASAGTIQMTLTAYVAGFAAGQLVYGPISDALGRRPVLMAGLIAFMLLSAMCALAVSADMLVLSRALQGLAGAATSVVIMALVRDLFEREDFARTMSFITLVVTVAPLVAPIIGGYLSVWLGWRSLFWLLAMVAAIVMLIAYWQIPETLAEEKRQPLQLRAALKNYARLLTHPGAMALVLAGALSFSGMFTFLTAGPFVYIELYGVEPQNFGYFFGANIGCMILITSLNGKWVKRVGIHSMLRGALALKIVAGIGLFCAWLLDWGLWGVAPFVTLYIGTISVIGSNSMGIILSEFPTMAGTASSITGTLRFGTAAVISALVALLPQAAWPMILVMALCSVSAASLYALSCRLTPKS
ncbi:Bcr/CflA family multidrug efflux MFS transporter [Paraferrimonas sedimenticola]|uniref:Bcr/CflA family efflux transporter n=1 Tax=Paraferrimonas sedimenticola TaxID=375674 RepID=A0AA37RYC4_9GAMM|nr:Bcr/CflA family multidrug efflux MFS transporter [Paraferrimonas sedimenticola]GLP97590.1 bicyclomycin/multidrug efflux system [Paraferrimonas sedimenticola]